MPGWSRGLAGRVCSWLAVRHAGWPAGPEIGSRNWIKKLDVPISDPIVRNGRSNFRSNFPIQFFSAFRRRGVLKKTGSKNWIRKLDHRIWCLVRSNFPIQFHDPIFRSNFLGPGQPGGWLGRQLTDFRPPGDSHPQLAVQKAARRLVSGGPQIRCIRFFFATFSVRRSEIRRSWTNIPFGMKPH